MTASDRTGDTNSEGTCGMLTLVIKDWKLFEGATDQQGTRVYIRGRAGGIFNWFLSLVGIDPTTSLVVTADKLLFTEASIGGRHNSVTPLADISTTFYGFSKPIWATVICFAIVLVLFGLLSAASGVFALMLLTPLVAVGGAIVYYFLNTRLKLAFVTMSGLTFAIHFKPSMIEGQRIDEAAANKVAGWLLHLADQCRR
jgi:hypothetical protein